jgi:hypothetical protein
MRAEYVNNPDTPTSVALHIAWMRGHVRCGTCKWLRLFPDEKGLYRCACMDSPYYALAHGLFASCATHWQPKEER